MSIAARIRPNRPMTSLTRYSSSRSSAQSDGAPARARSRGPDEINRLTCDCTGSPRVFFACLTLVQESDPRVLEHAARTDRLFLVPDAQRPEGGFPVVGMIGGGQL